MLAQAGHVAARGTDIVAGGTRAALDVRRQAAAEGTRIAAVGEAAVWDAMDRGEDRCEIECPWHGSVFCAKDGGVREGPATFPEPAYEVRVGDSGAIEVRAR